MSRWYMPVYPSDVMIYRLPCAEPGSELSAAHFLPHDVAYSIHRWCQAPPCREIDAYIRQDRQAKMRSDPDRDSFSLITR